jgi:hypothetical protein
MRMKNTKCILPEVLVNKPRHMQCCLQLETNQGKPQRERRREGEKDRAKGEARTVAKRMAERMAKRMPTAPGVPVRSPITVLTQPDCA